MALDDHVLRNDTYKSAIGNLAQNLPGYGRFSLFCENLGQLGR